MTAATDAFSAIGRALVGQARESMRQARAEAAARPVGMKAYGLGLTDYRRQPDPDIRSSDWAVWRFRWDGHEWAREKRMTAWQSLSEARDSIARLCAESDLPNVSVI